MEKIIDLFIDFDDTLYDTRGNAIIALSEIYEWAHLSDYFDDPNTFYDAYWKANIELWGLYSKGEIERSYLMVERFRRPLAIGKGNPRLRSAEFLSLPYTKEEEDYCLEISDKFLEYCSVKPGVVDGAHELMDYLKSRGYRLHICSNGFHEVQYKKLTASRLLDYFDTIILSEAAGANKPSKQFFDYALAKTGAKRETTLMIGDNYNTDILGAQNAGIRTMLFNRWDASFVPPTPVDYCVSNLRDIMKIL